MSGIEPTEPLLSKTPPPGRPIVWQVAASAALHLAVLLVLLWPALRGSLEATAPPAIDVELVPAPSEPSSAEVVSAASSDPRASEDPAIEQSSMGAGAAPSALSEPRAADASPRDRLALEQPSAAASSMETSPPAAPEADSPQPVAPVPMSRPVVVTIGTMDEVATDISSVEPNGAGELTAETGDVSAGGTATSSQSGNGRAATLGELHVADIFYLAQILDSAAMANARAALESLPFDKRVSQTCNIEAIGQVANAGSGFNPDAVIVDAFSQSTVSGTRLTAAGAIFRSEGKWYALAFDCTLNDDLTGIADFTFRLGPDVTSVVTASGSATPGR